MKAEEFNNMYIKKEFETDDLLIIDKPAGLPVYTAKKHAGEDSVLAWFLQNYPDAKKVGDPERPGIVHRLDKQTSGLLVLAKTQDAFEYLKKLFQSRNITKEYLALVSGQLPKHGLIEKPLSKIGHEGQSRVRVDEKGKIAVTEYWTMDNYKHGLDRFTLLRVKLHTGRTHQIRVHFASERHPVMGDNLYGKPLSLKLYPLLQRQFLHASRLEFQLPDGTWLEVESGLPEDLQQVIARLKVESEK